MKIVIRNLFRLSLAAGLLVGASLVNAELLVVVNPGNAMTTISAKDLSRLYLGKARAFPGGGRANPVNQPAGSAARNEFYQTYANMKDAQVKSHWSKLIFSGNGNPPAEAANDAAVKAAGIAVDLGGISKAEASWGFGFGVTGHEAWAKFGGGLSNPATFRHGGAGGIDGWVDPTTGVVAVYIEIVTEDTDDGMPWSWASHRFQDVVNAAVVDP